MGKFVQSKALERLGSDFVIGGGYLGGRFVKRRPRIHGLKTVQTLLAGLHPRVLRLPFNSLCSLRVAQDDSHFFLIKDS